MTPRTDAQQPTLRHIPDNELGEVLKAQLAFCDTMPAISQCGIVCDMTQLANSADKPLAETRGLECRGPFWLDISSPDLVPGLVTATPEQEHERVVALV